MYLAKTPGIAKSLFKDVVWSIPAEENILYLTFDDGPAPKITQWVLETLKEYGAKATFFCVGANAEKHPEIIEAIKASGNGLGLHSYSHLNGRRTDDKVYLDDIAKCAGLIDSTLFRPPYGKATKSQIAQLKSNYSIIMWDVLSGDFDKKTSPEKCLANVTKNADRGSIVVFHDSPKAETNLRYALPKALDYFSERGFRFDVVPHG